MAQGNRGRALVIRVARFVLRLFFRYQIIGLEKIPAGGAVLAANHRSLTDAPLLWIAGDREIRFMATAGLFRIPLFGLLLRWLGCIPVYRHADRRPANAHDQMFAAAVAAVEAGELVGIYPEGRIIKPSELEGEHPAKSGIVTLNRRGCTVVPVVMFDARRSVLRLWRPVTIVICDPIPPHAEGHDLLQELDKLFAVI